MEGIEHTKEYEMSKDMLREMGMKEEILDQYLFDLLAIIEMSFDSYFEELGRNCTAERTALSAMRQSKDEVKFHRLLNATKKKRKPSS